VISIALAEIDQMRSELHAQPWLSYADHSTVKEMTRLGEALNKQRTHYGLQALKFRQSIHESVVEDVQVITTESRPESRISVDLSLLLLEKARALLPPRVNMKTPDPFDGSATARGAREAYITLPKKLNTPRAARTVLSGSMTARHRPHVLITETTPEEEDTKLLEDLSSGLEILCQSRPERPVFSLAKQLLRSVRSRGEHIPTDLEWVVAETPPTSDDESFEDEF